MYIWIIDFSYRENLYICDPATGSETDQILFNYASTKPADLAACQWELVSAKRSQVGAPLFDAWLRTIFSLYTTTPEGIMIWMNFLVFRICLYVSEEIFDSYRGDCD